MPIHINKAEPMILDHNPVKTNPLFELHYVFEARWGDAKFDELDQIQISLLTGESAIQLSFQDCNRVLLGRSSARDTDEVTALDHESDATIPTISHEFRQQLMQMAEQEHMKILHTSNLNVVDLQQLAVDLSGVSRRHALLEKDGHYVTLTDLHSTNGTYLNGTLLHPMQRRILRNDDKLQLGDLRLWVRFCRVG